MAAKGHKIMLVHLDNVPVHSYKLSNDILGRTKLGGLHIHPIAPTKHFWISSSAIQKEKYLDGSES
jgi:hypothetical protein